MTAIFIVLKILIFSQYLTNSLQKVTHKILQVVTISQHFVFEFYIHVTEPDRVTGVGK